MAKVNDDISALFQLPLAEFIAARKALAARLKKEGRTDEAERVKLLAKPPISAWTVNQLYWEHRAEFDRLMSTGQRVRKAQTSGKVAEMRDALDARRETLNELSELATEVLSEAGHNPSLDTLRRITTTLEALSALSDGPTPGRLTQDVDPPGFDSFAGFISTAPTPERAEEPKRGALKAASTQAKQKTDAAQLEKTRQAKIAVAKVSLQNAKKALASARTETQSLETEKKKVDVAAKEAEKQKREAEQRFKKARIVAGDATERAQRVAAELEEAEEALENAKRAVDQATKELESLFRSKL